MSLVELSFVFYHFAMIGISTNDYFTARQEGRYLALLLAIEFSLVVND